MLKLIVAIMVIMSSQQVLALECQELVSELMAMKKAQSQIFQSLANNHESFAVALEEYSTELAMAKRSAPKKVLNNMDQSAEVFRVRGVQAKKMSLKFEAATADLINQIEQCLKK